MQRRKNIALKGREFLSIVLNDSLNAFRREKDHSKSSKVQGVTVMIHNYLTLILYTFLTIARFFFRARALVFLAEQDEKTFFSYRDFGYKEFYFLKGKKLALVKKMAF